MQNKSFYEGGDGSLAYTEQLNTLTADGNIILPASGDFLRADFARAGPDLLIETPDGGHFVVSNFYMSETPPALITQDGAMLSADLVTILAGPQAPAMLAQLNIGTSSAQQGITFGEPIGQVSEAQGSVTVTHPDGTQETLITGGQIFQGDILQTAAGANVSIIFVDDTVFSLDEDGRMVMDEMVYDPDTQTGTFRANIVQGVFSFVSGQVAKTSPDGMIVNTPTATIGIRGSTVLGKAAAEGAENTVTLVSDVDGNVGEITISNGAGTLTLNSAGATTTVFSTTSAPTSIVVLSPTQIQQSFGNSLTHLVQTIAHKAQQDAQQAEANAQQADSEAQQAEAASQQADADSQQAAQDAAQAQAEAETAQAQAEAAQAEAEAAQAEAEAAGNAEAKAKAQAAEAKAAEAAQKAADSKAQAEAEAQAAAKAQAQAEAQAAEAAAKATQAEAAQAQADEAQQFSSLAETASQVQTQAFTQVQQDQRAQTTATGADKASTAASTADTQQTPNTANDADAAAQTAAQAAADAAAQAAADAAAQAAADAAAQAAADAAAQAAADAAAQAVALAIAQQASTQATTTTTTTTSTTTTALTTSTTTPAPATTSIPNLSTLDGSDGFRLDGAALYDLSGWSVSSAGDINGDGFDDVIIGALLADPYDTSSGSTYVVFGKASGFTATTNLSTLNGTNGFRLDGGAIYDQSGNSVSSAGDVNGDGFDDLIIGARWADPNAVSSSGSTYVVFGKASGFTATTKLSTLNGTSGFRLDGSMANDFSGWSVSSAGDINGDGFDDVIIGAVLADPNGASSGSNYVVFGKASGFATTTNLSTLNGTNGFRLDGVAIGDFSGRSVSSAGDVNGDGFDDLIIGANAADPNGNNSGSAYVMFGKASGFTATTNLATLNGTTGFRLNGAASADYSGWSVSSAGDVNGDGFDDLIVAAKNADPNGLSSGSSYVVFGKASGFAATTNLSTLNGTTGFRLDGAAANDFSGYSVSSAGDVNGDGFDDLIVGAKYADTNGINSGSSYVVFGKASGFAATTNLSTLNGTTGFRLNGVAANDQSGFSVSSAGDVNGDGFDDLIVGADKADPNGIDSGSSYVIFGGNFSGAVTQLGTSGADTLTGTTAAETFVGGQGNDTITGGGGADVIIGGSGDDTAIIADTAFKSIDGGSGMDTIKLSGGGLSLDLTAIADNKISGIERIDITGTGNNTLTLGLNDVVNMTDGINALTSSAKTLIIDGNAGDTVTAGNGWIADNATTIGAQVYNQFTQGGTKLLVDTDITQTGIKGPATIQLSSLNGATGFRLDGSVTGDRAGGTVSNAGDVNGDGFDDLIIGASGNNRGAYVVFGKASGFAPTATLNTTTLDGTTGFYLNGGVGIGFGGSVSAAGDVNGDGFDDIIVGANGGGTPLLAGAFYVVFGKASGFTATVNMSSLVGTNGFRLDSSVARESFGSSVSSAGDINGDGFDDLIIGAVGASLAGGPYNAASSSSGAAYVMFGKASGFTAVSNLSTLTSAAGFRLAGLLAGDLVGESVNRAGDINGDGFDDLIIGARGADPNGTSSGSTYVLFGKSSGVATTNLAALNGTNGFRLDGAAAGDQSGRSVSSAGDVNGDGFDDLIIGARAADPNGAANAGSSYIIFGKALGFTATTNLASLDGTTGFRLDGAFGADNAGVSVSSAGDVNGDGFDDLIVGALYADPNGLSSGSSYIVFGKASGFAATTNLSTLDGTDGFRLDGAVAADTSGSTVSSAGDVNGDGFADLIVGANGADPNGSNSGSSYVVFGGNFTGAVTKLGTAGADTLTGTGVAETFVGGQGADTIIGGGGADVMTGGSGADVFRYTASSDGAAAGVNTGYDRVMDFIASSDTFNLSGTFATQIDDITANSALSWATDAGTRTIANFTTTHEALLITKANNVTDAQLTTSGFASVLTAINANTITSATGNDALIAVQGGNNTAVYTYLEAGTAGVQAGELSLLSVVENQHLATLDFTLGQTLV